MTMTTQSITSGQERQIMLFTHEAAKNGILNALESMNLDKNGLQRVIEHGDEYQAAIEATITAKLKELSLTEQFDNEEVNSDYGYPSGYREARRVGQQMAVLHHYFPQLQRGLGYVDWRNVPQGAEGYFAIPRWQTLAPTYNQAVERVLDVLEMARGDEFLNRRQIELLSPDRLRETERKQLAFERISNEQTSHEVLVVGAQFGLRHRGRSDRRARAVMGRREFGLGAFEVGIMLLTHPERLKRSNDLWIYCAGDEYSSDADGRLEFTPYFRFGDGRLEFSTHWFDRAYGRFGSASAFLY